MRLIAKRDERVNTKYQFGTNTVRRSGGSPCIRSRGSEISSKRTGSKVKKARGTGDDRSRLKDGLPHGLRVVTEKIPRKKGTQTHKAWRDEIVYNV